MIREFLVALSLLFPALLRADFHAETWNARFVPGIEPETDMRVGGCDLPDSHWSNDFTPRNTEMQQSVLELALASEDGKLVIAG